MARKRKSRIGENVEDYHHEDARRKNNPPAGIAPTYEVRERRIQSYAYDPHLDPQLQWAGKAEHTSFDVDVVSLHIHERISTRAILDAVRRPEPLQLSLFGETPLPMDQQIQFYQHEVGWANRLILGDSLLVMNSLLVKEGMAGKVQMIYVDPPYGIKYSSNFQPRVDRRDVKDQDQDLTREPEQIKAYRDTWKLGTHSYLTYLRDRLLLARDLLTESGSIFVQINDENLHVVRSLLDEVFGRENFCMIIQFQKTGQSTSGLPPVVCDYLLWYARRGDLVKTRRLFRGKLEVDKLSRDYSLEDDRGLHRLVPLNSQHYSPTRTVQVEVAGTKYWPGDGRQWSVDPSIIPSLHRLDLVVPRGKALFHKMYAAWQPVVPLTNMWDDTARGEFGGRLLFSVQTATKVVERCVLMSTDPGDLVLDPTCGSGTTALCAEKWGRRWLTCDTSRVALAIARQRLMTGRYEYYELKEPEHGPAGGFNYETVPHITLESVAKNPEIDTIAGKYQPQIDEALQEVNRAAGKEWREWEVPRDAQADWPKDAQEAHESFWALKRRERQEIDDSIQRNAPQETLYDRPKVTRGVVRVTGPFTVEAIPVPAVEDPSQAPVPQFEEEETQARISDRGGDYLTTMLNLLKEHGGILFPGGRRMELRNLRSLNVGMLHAEGETRQNGREKRVAVSFGPQYGPVTAVQVAEAIPTARNNAYDALVLAGFSFDPEAQAFIQKAPVKDLEVHFANIAPDVLVGDLLKTTRASQVFTVFGQPDVQVQRQKDATYTVQLRGVDIYDPVTGETEHSAGGDVRAWFLDSNYDGLTFHICQAFFPGDADAWDKLQRALKAFIDPEAFEQMRGTVSFPFEAGEHKRIAVKVVDFRGNEVIRVARLEGGAHA